MPIHLPHTPLPPAGPTSTQMGFALGVLKKGLSGGLLSGALFQVRCAWGRRRPAECLIAGGRAIGAHLVCWRRVSCAAGPHTLAHLGSIAACTSMQRLPHKGR